MKIKINSKKEIEVSTFTEAKQFINAYAQVLAHKGNAIKTVTINGTEVPFCKVSLFLHAREKALTALADRIDEACQVQEQRGYGDTFKDMIIMLSDKLDEIIEDR